MRVKKAKIMSQAPRMGWIDPGVEAKQGRSVLLGGPEYSVDRVVQINFGERPVRNRMQAVVELGV